MTDCKYQCRYCHRGVNEGRFIHDDMDVESFHFKCSQCIEMEKKTAKASVQRYSPQWLLDNEDWHFEKVIEAILVEIGFNFIQYQTRGYGDSDIFITVPGQPTEDDMSRIKEELKRLGWNVYRDAYRCAEYNEIIVDCNYDNGEGR